MPALVRVSVPEQNPLHFQVGPDRLWTIVNTSEAMPGVLTPLGWTFWEMPLERAMRECYRDFGVLRGSEVAVPDDREHHFSTVFFGRWAFNVQQIRQTFGERMFGTSGAAIEEDLFGELKSGLPDVRDRSRLLPILLKAPPMTVLLPGRIRRARRETDAWWRRTVFGPAPADPAALLAEAVNRHQQVLYHHILASLITQGGYQAVKRLGARAGAPGIERRLISGYGGVEEVSLAQSLWRCSRGEITIAEFLGRHGFHGSGEGEVANPTWRVEPAGIQRLLPHYAVMDANPADVERARGAARRAAEAELLARIPTRRGRVQARLVLRFARSFIPLREVGKSAFLQCIDVGRFAATQLGAELARDGRLGRPDDVFFLTADELTGGRTDPATFAALVAERRRTREGYLGLALPPYWFGNPDPIPAEPGPGPGPELESGPEPTPRSPAETTVITGVAVCGEEVVTGRARVVRDPDTDAFEPGEILVTVLTDPSWVPLFMLASAIVIDVGGTMSHAAIVARELGIPCVINTKIGTATIRTGDTLLVDPVEGRVEVRPAVTVRSRG